MYIHDNSFHVSYEMFYLYRFLWRKNTFDFFMEQQIAIQVLI